MSTHILESLRATYILSYLLHLRIGLAGFGHFVECSQMFHWAVLITMIRSDSGVYARVPSLIRGCKRRWQQILQIVIKSTEQALDDERSQIPPADLSFSFSSTIMTTHLPMALETVFSCCSRREAARRRSMLMWPLRNLELLGSTI